MSSGRRQAGARGGRSGTWSRTSSAPTSSGLSPSGPRWRASRRASSPSSIRWRHRLSSSKLADRADRRRARPLRRDERGLRRRCRRARRRRLVDARRGAAGPRPLRAVALHALWDSWIHERDIVVPLGLTPVEEPDEIAGCLVYGAALGPALSVAGGATRQGAVTVEATNPDFRFVVEVGESVVVRRRCPRRCAVSRWPGCGAHRGTELPWAAALSGRRRRTGGSSAVWRSSTAKRDPRLAADVSLGHAVRPVHQTEESVRHRTRSVLRRAGARSADRAGW